MKQIWHHYTTWEDFQNGMYDEVKEGRQERIKKAVEILTDTELLYQCMKRVTKEWKFATEQELTNMSINHQAFLGQAACNIHAGVKEDETREAWGYLTKYQRYAANRIANRVDKEWVMEYERNKPNSQMSLLDLLEKEEDASEK